ncbi:TPA: hypothetical protein ACQQSQ_006490 [Pseudomonas aeruginosa]|uniref:hypothetical protein n=1 Tax=Pseudomonas aeruginosa TaxID=287 RepID=UPI0024116963|nr:hypothetical protein [Pseudomonas aeruginosa]MDG4002928.1 hypothetical protein [Pseudomonas aeruginosa]MDG4212473.1 hypothetical protein [Pseudomonas aeruginosa]MDG4312407.1 hypothetical protein [Pseudomonas aeruginosa]
MAKDTRDTQTLDAFPAKPSRGRPRKADALSNAERQRLYRQRQAGKAPQVDADALVRLQNEFDRHVDDARALVAHLRKMELEVDLCRQERSDAMRVNSIYRERLELAGLPTDY